jgi:hypothetical protein
MSKKFSNTATHIPFILKSSAIWPAGSIDLSMPPAICLLV